MPFDPKNFLDVAKLLNVQAGGEKSWRTSINRSYYSVHGYIHINTERGVSSFSGQKKNRHDELIYFYKNSSGVAKKIGMNLEQLFKNRVDADYKYDIQIQFSFCQYSIQLAENILKDFDSLSK